MTPCSSGAIRPSRHTYIPVVQWVQAQHAKAGFTYELTISSKETANAAPEHPLTRATPQSALQRTVPCAAPSESVPRADAPKRSVLRAAKTGLFPLLLLLLSAFATRSCPIITPSYRCPSLYHGNQRKGRRLAAARAAREAQVVGE